MKIQRKPLPLLKQKKKKVKDRRARGQGDLVLFKVLTLPKYHTV
jgi:hypothetical protein